MTDKKWQPKRGRLTNNGKQKVDDGRQKVADGRQKEADSQNKRQPKRS